MGALMTGFSLGLIDQLLTDRQVTEIMVNGMDGIFFERDGRLYKSGLRFSSPAELMLMVQSIASFSLPGKDERMSFVDIRLPDGSRANIVMPPAAVKGPDITIRKHLSSNRTIGELLKTGTLNDAMAEFLIFCVKSKKNIVLAGGTGAGKTTLLAVLSSFIDTTERVITIEDTAELQLQLEHVVSLESSKPVSCEQVSIRDLLKNSLRMRPDRLIVGECRGAEIMDMLQAMNTGHAGSLTTIHANSPRDCLKRIELMILLSGIDAPLKAIREHISSAIDIIVQIARINNGSRKITEIAEVSGMEGDVITLATIFSYSPGPLAGGFTASGTIPESVQSSEEGMSVDRRIFDHA